MFNVRSIERAYHWSCKENRLSIQQNGLQICQPQKDGLTNPNGALVRFPWICLGMDPLIAWEWSGVDLDREAVYDLWQIRLTEHDNVQVRMEHGNFIAELRIHNTIPADRVFWVGSRGVYSHDDDGA